MSSSVRKKPSRSLISPGKARVFVQSAYEDGRTSLLEFEAGQVARQFGIPVAKYGLAENETQALHLARGIGYPVVMKIVSPDILHKSDVGGVVTNINSPAEVRQAFRQIMKNVRAKINKKYIDIRGILVQKMAPKGTEFVVGGLRDPQFGPTVMFGMGGIYVELYKDVAFRLAPLSEAEALEMMKEIKGAPLLTGFRGSKPLDMHAAAKVIVSVGKLLKDLEKVESVDINPLIIYPKGVNAVDVRIIIERPQEKEAPARPTN